MVANHAMVILPPERPNRQKTGCPVVQQHGLHDAVDPFGCHDLKQGEGAAINIPDGKGGIIHAVGCQGHAVVGPAVPAIGVCNVGRLQQQVVQSGVKNGFLCISGFNIDASKILIPNLFCALANRVKMPVWHFGFQIAFGTSHVDGGQSDFHLQHF